MEGGAVHTQSLRFRCLCMGVLVEAFLASVLVSMQEAEVEVVVPAPSPAPGVANVTVRLRPCWNWAQENESGHQDCSLDLVFTAIIMCAVAMAVVLLSTVTYHLKRSGRVDLDCCVNLLTQSRAWCFVEYYLPLFAFIVTVLLLIVFVALVLEDRRSVGSMPDWLNLRELMVHRKPWRIGLTSAALVLAFVACIPAGQLAVRWHRSDLFEGGPARLGRRSKRRGKKRPTLKSHLIFDNNDL